MSRYVNLDGNTWDGTPISSKIQEVETKYGYMSGITVGWLYGDNVPHIDLEEHDKQLLEDYAKKHKQSVSISKQLEETAEKICDEFCIYRCTCDENAECNYIRCGNTCPLDALL